MRSKLLLRRNSNSSNRHRSNPRPSLLRNSQTRLRTFLRLRRTPKILNLLRQLLPSGIQEAKPAPVGDNIIEGVDFRGQQKVPQDTLRALIYTKKGDVYDEEAIHRDFIALWNTGRFDDLRVEKENVARTAESSCALW